jgi:hypothetical protein
MHEAQLLGQLRIYALKHIVEVGVGRINGHVGFERRHNGLFDQALAGEPFERPENDWVMTHDYVAAALAGLGYHGGRAVEGK